MFAYSLRTSFVYIFFILLDNVIWTSELLTGMSTVDQSLPDDKKLCKLNKNQCDFVANLTTVGSHIDDSNTHLCRFCNSIFTSAKLLADHKEEKHKGKVYKCELCNSTLSSLSSFAMHNAEKHFTTAFKCDLCSSLFISASALVMHKEKNHKTLEEKSISVEMKVEEDLFKINCDAEIKGEDLSLVQIIIDLMKDIYK